MPIPPAVAKFNRRVTNRVLAPLARWLPGFGIIVHTGRTSGRTYRTPVNVFRRNDCYTIALTYGPDADWVRNVLAASGAVLETQGHTLRVTQPRIVHDERQLPAPVRLVLRLANVIDFLELESSAAMPNAMPKPTPGQ
ncbi:MAG: nitroreductase family deazaflavin-dependent oxidoreductase [Thermomicrobiales bacterium]|nr:nitroreductase family deazaflavin-dependent oxidoreductase [Thermomicrobiales bacterium]